MREEIVKSNEYRDYSLIEDSKKQFCSGEYFKSILDKQIDMLEYQTTHHSKVMMARFDIRTEEKNDKKLCSKDITRIMSNTKRNIENRYKKSESKNKPDIHYQWSMERTDEEKSSHWHVALFANGNAIKDTRPIIEEVNRQVKKVLNTKKNGLVHNANSGDDFNHGVGMLLKRDDPDFTRKMNVATQRMAYMAKCQSKESTPKHARMFSASHIPKE